MFSVWAPRSLRIRCRSRREKYLVGAVVEVSELTENVQEKGNLLVRQVTATQNAIREIDNRVAWITNELNKMAAGTAKCVSCARPRKSSPSPQGGERVEGTDGRMYLTQHPATGVARAPELPRGGGKSVADAARSQRDPKLKIKRKIR